MNRHRSALVIILLALTSLLPDSALTAQNDCPSPLMFYEFNGETRATVTATAGINLRAEPTTAAALVDTIPDGVDIVIDAQAEPVCADGYRWQHVTYAGQTGWVAEGRGGEEDYNLVPVILRSGTQGRVSYTVDERLSSRTLLRVIAPDADTSEPGYVEIQFTNYRYAGVEFVDTPYFLRLYHTADLRQLEQYERAMDQVRDALYARVNQEPVSAELPLLPPLDGVAESVARMTVLHFDGGAGVRDLVAYLEPPSGARMPLVYRYMGMTADGDYFLSLTVPVSSNQLDAATTEALAAQADELPDDAFAPNLNLLDDLVRSLRVNRAESVTDVAIDAPTEAAFAGIRFDVPPEIARRVEFDLVPPSGDIFRMSMSGPQPGRIAVTFVGYPDENSTRDPLLAVIDAAGDTAGAPGLAQEMTALRDLLDARPALATAEFPDDDPVAQMFLGGGESLFIQPAYVDFGDGRGVRYLTFFSQNYVFDVEPNDLYYAFEGLTEDGRYQIYAIFPVSSGYSLTTEPYDLTVLENGVDAAQQREREYIAALSRELDTVPGDAFTPGLATLDALIESLRVG